MKRMYLTTALAALVAASPAFATMTLAQTDETRPPEQVQEKPMNEQQSSGGNAVTGSAGSIEFISSQKNTDWLVSSLMGRNVQNSQGETLGEINNVILDQNGDVVAVLIGVGGFLGIGGKDVAVNYESLEFKQRAAMSTTSGEDTSQTTTQDNTTTGGGGQSGSSMVQDQQQQSAAETEADADHSNKVIVLNATNEQLESAPAFKRLGQSDTAGSSETAPAEKQDKLNTQQQSQ